jgi:hypothetical protein
LTVTDVFSGWIRLFGLLNKARRRALEKPRPACQTSIFKILASRGDGGSEFINHDAIGWRKPAKTPPFTHSPRHKNGDCYAERKNNAFARKSGAAAGVTTQTRNSPP